MAAPVTKDQEVELDVESLAYGGNGVARLEGFVVFVRRGLPGDRVRARVTKVKRSHAEAIAVEVLSPGPKRVEAPCKHYPACGGCRFQDLAYEAQLPAPGNDARNALPHIAFTVPYNMSEQPAASINWSTSVEGLPIGVQVIGSRFDDLGLLKLCRLIEKIRPKPRDWPDP